MKLLLYFRVVKVLTFLSLYPCLIAMLSFRPVQLGEMASGGGTPRAEALLEERRRLLRNALKGEFIRKKYNPVNYSADGGTITTHS